VEFIQQTKERLGRPGTVGMMNDLHHVTSTGIRLQDMLSKLLEYVDAVTVSKRSQSVVYLAYLSYLSSKFGDVKTLVCTLCPNKKWPQK